MQNLPTVTVIIMHVAVYVAIHIAGLISPCVTVVSRELPRRTPTLSCKRFRFFYAVTVGQRATFHGETVYYGGRAFAEYALFETEKAPLTRAEYERLKALALRSAKDFLALYASIPDKNAVASPPRKTFYGQVPRSAEEMYAHTKSVNVYYFAEIGVEADNSGSILDCRKRGFDELEQTPDFLQNAVVEGSYGELWSLRKVLRRFLWHDRIHAKAMYRMALKTFGAENVENPFCF